MSSRLNLKMCRQKQSKPPPEFVAVYPKGEVLHTTQNRLREKTFLSENGFPVAPFRHIKTLDDLYHAVAGNRNAVAF